ncbi:hypothetical protein Tco_0553476 [Tanacetum coccineum]
MAIKILSLTTSSSRCERNWRAFEGERVKNQNIDVLRSLDASKARSWIVAISDDGEIEEDGSPGVGGDTIGVDRELHEDDFVSNEEQVEGEENLEFNSDEEDMSNNEGEVEHDAEHNDEERVLLASLITNLKLDIDENKRINKDMKKANRVLSHELAKYKHFHTNHKDKQEVELKCAKAFGLLEETKTKCDKSLSLNAIELFNIKQDNTKLEEQFFAHERTISQMSSEKVELNFFYEQRKDKDIKKVIDLEKQVKF